MATTSANVEIPKNSLDLNLTLPTADDASSTQPPASSDGGGGQPKGKSAELATGTTGAENGGAVTDIQKKMKRAERFGMPVHLSEEEKRNSRAERFGTGSAVNGLDSSKPSEELKRKARAERFGIVQSGLSDEEAKKRARLARFGSFSKTDSVEEDKKKARAIRFKQPDSRPTANGKGNIEKTRIAGKAGEGT
ncbi:hypothetical protein CDL12_19389 [Handroanthus impetiginosus]|uniref:THO1-MOS11 C-terminal domain-containing protein n=1 Tax=Handroanthus impetiginosus TaxID=429701 RepID=A0A2G9GRW5_9LAMI|nr:hypothetical protein CDL12_19389 [Handroanthus impetiginosus]